MAEEESADLSQIIGDDFFGSGGQVSTDTKGGSGYQELGKNFDELVGQSKTTKGHGYATVKWNPYSSDRILGLPLYYNDFADPNGRVYNQTIIKDIPSVYIVPGVPSVNRKLIDVAGKRIIPADLSRALMNFTNDPSNIFNFGMRGLSSSNDLRFIGFKADYSEYFKYVQVMLSTIHSYLNMTGVFDVFAFSKEFNNSLRNFGLCFYADKATSVSESADNTYSPSKVAEMVSEQSATLREADLLYPTGSTTARIVDSIKAANPLGVLDALGTFDGIITRTSNALFRVVNGSQLFFPDMWQESRFDKSYNISFKFYSPYGDKMSIFRYVYVPFIALLALTLPRQDGLLAYQQPFFVKMSRPGFFNIDMGAITSMSIIKGGSDNLWTIDGLPQVIEVNLNVVDLYPQMVQVKDIGLLAYNLGISSFLENMAGIRADQLNFSLRAKALIQRTLSNSMISDLLFGNNGKIKDTIGNNVEDFVYELQNKVTNILR
ncbi:hypothetical protein Bp8pS_264 [Bacillus phage vB_BpuM-BpSp]|nr:hypothetical protein Bp8pS_264 [Bacillus phage vB_BpuM-BpSp]